MVPALVLLPDWFHYLVSVMSPAYCEEMNPDRPAKSSHIAIVFTNRCPS